MTEKKDGGPAFPYAGASAFHHEGLTLRQYYAAAALTGIISSLGKVETFDKFSEAAFGLADSMIAHEAGEESK